MLPGGRIGAREGEGSAARTVGADAAARTSEPAGRQPRETSSGVVPDRDHVIGVPAWAQSGSARQSQRSQRANSSNGTQPRLRLGDRTSGSGRPTGMTPIGTNSSGMPR